MSRRSFGLPAVFAVLLACAPAALAAGPASVTVRVEGDSATLVPRTALTTTTTPVTKNGGNCTGTSAAGALDQATAGDWSGAYDAGYQDYTVETIRGETHTFSSPEYWSLFVNEEPSAGGICHTELQAGDRVLFAPVSASAKTIGVLSVSGVPAQVAPGTPFTVTVTRTTTSYDSSYNATTTREPAAGAAIGGATTGSDGRATITLTDRGPAGLRATGGADDIRSATDQTCVTDGSDGACGSPAAAGPCATTGRDGLCGTADRTAPRGKITAIRNGQRFGKGKGPRTLKGFVTPDPSGIGHVRLRLTRTAAHHRCTTYDGKREQLVEMRRCGAARGRWFDAGNREQWSYLLPTRLPAGRYVLDLRVSDAKGNADTTLQRTRNRVVFTVS